MPRKAKPFSWIGFDQRHGCFCVVVQVGETDGGEEGQGAAGADGEGCRDGGAACEVVLGISQAGAAGRAACERGCGLGQRADHKAARRQTADWMRHKQSSKSVEIDAISA